MEPNDLVLWIESRRAITFGDTFIDRHRGFEFPRDWANKGVPADEILASLQPLRELPVEFVLPTHGDPTDRARSSGRLAEAPGGSSRRWARCCGRSIARASRRGSSAGGRSTSTWGGEPEHADLDLAVWERIRSASRRCWRTGLVARAGAGRGRLHRLRARRRAARAGFLVRVEDGLIFTPTSTGFASWADGAFGDEAGELEGIRARLIGRAALREEKAGPRSDPRPPPKIAPTSPPSTS